MRPVTRSATRRSDPTQSLLPRKQTRLSAASVRESALHTRRQRYEQIARHHVDELSLLLHPSPHPFSPASQGRHSRDPAAALSPVPPHAPLAPALAVAALEMDDVEQGLQAMQHMLRRLQKVANLVDDDVDPESDILRLPKEKHRPVRELAATLAAERFRCHADDVFRLLTSACLAELLRICAPDPPIDHLLQKAVCELFIDQLSVLASPNDCMEAIRFSLLEQLATVQSFVIVSDDTDFICDIFACFYAIARPHHPAKMRQYFADILSTLLNEADTVNNQLLDVVLAPLVPALAYSPSALQLAEKALSEATKRIEVPLCYLLNASVRAIRIDPQPELTTPSKRKLPGRKSPAKKTAHNGSDSELSANLSEHHAHFSDLILAIDRFAPDVLIYVLPLFLDRLRSTDVAVRLGAVTLLSGLFTSRVDMATSFPAVFAEFLARYVDIEVPVRRVIVSSFGELLPMHPKQAEHLDNMLQERLHDTDELIRIEAVRAIGKTGDAVSDATLARLGSRLQDKKEAVRGEALKQIIALCTSPPRRLPYDAAASADTRDSLFSENDGEPIPLVPSADMSGDVGSHSKEVPNTGSLDRMLKRLSSLPNVLIDGYVALRRAGHHVAAYAIERAIFEKICFSFNAKGADDDQSVRIGMRRFALFLSQLNESNYGSFCTLAMERSHTRRRLLRVAQLRLQGRASSSSSGMRTNNGGDDETSTPSTPRAPDSAVMSRGNMEEALSAAKELVNYFPASSGNSNVVANCEGLASAVDLKIFSQIVEAIHCDRSVAAVNEAALDATARLDSTSAVGLFCADHLLPRCRVGLFSSTFFSVACELAVEITSEVRREQDSDADVDSEEQRRQESVQSRLLVGLVRYFEVVGPHFQETLIPSTEMISQLIKLPVKGNDYSAEVVLCGLRLGLKVPTDGLKNFDRPDLQIVLDKLVFAQKFERLRFASKLAKRATRLLIRMDRAGVQTTVFSKLGKKAATRFEKFDGDFMTLIGPLAAMSQIAKHAPSAFQSVSLLSFDFARVLLGGSLNTKIALRKQAGSDGAIAHEADISNISCQDILLTLGRGGCELLLQGIGTVSGLCLAEAVSSAAKLLVYALKHVDSSEELGNVVIALMSIIGEKRGDVFGLCGDGNSSSVDKEGVSSIKMADSIIRATNRLSVGRAILFLARHPNFFRSLTPDMMVTTMLLAQDEHPIVRICFAKCVWNSLMKKRLPLRWTVSMALMAVDPVTENVEKVRTMVTQVFRQRRLTCERARVKWKTLTTQLLPESTLADLMWVLANLPGVEIEQEIGFPESKKCIEMLLDCLLESKEYANVLNEYIDSVSIAEDATEDMESGCVRTDRLKELSRMSSELLKKKMAGRKLDLIEQSKRILLPGDLFRTMDDRRASSADVMRPALMNVAKKYDERTGLGGRGMQVDTGNDGQVQSTGNVEAEPVTQTDATVQMSSAKADEDDCEIVEENRSGRKRVQKRRSGRGTKRRGTDIEESVTPLEAHGKGRADDLPLDEKEKVVKKKSGRPVKKAKASSTSATGDVKKDGDKKNEVKGVQVRRSARQRAKIR